MNHYTSLVPPTLINFIWKDIEYIIDSIISKAHGEMTIETVRKKLVDDNALLVICYDEYLIKGLIILQVEVFDSGLRVLNVSMAGGELDVFTGEYDPIMIEIAKNLKCDEIRAIGARVGWERMFKAKHPNWSKLSTTLMYKVEY